MSEELLELLSYLKLRLGDDFFGELRRVVGRTKLLGASPPSGVLETLYLGEILVRKGPEAALKVIREHAPSMTSFLDSIDRKIVEVYDVLYASEMNFVKNLARYGYVNDAKISALTLIDELSRKFDGKKHSPYDVLIAMSKTFANISADAQSVALSYNEECCFPKAPCFPSRIEELSLESLLRVINALVNSIKVSEGREALSKRIKEIEEKRIKEIANSLFPDETVRIISDLHDAADALLTDEPPSIIIYDNSDSELATIIEETLEVSRSTVIPLLDNDSNGISLHRLYIREHKVKEDIRGKIPAPVQSIKDALNSILDYISLGIIPSIMFKDNGVHLISTSGELRLDDLIDHVPGLEYIWRTQDKNQLEWLGFLIVALLRHREYQKYS